MRRHLAIRFGILAGFILFVVTLMAAHSRSKAVRVTAIEAARLKSETARRKAPAPTRPEAQPTVTDEEPEPAPTKPRETTRPPESPKPGIPTQKPPQAVPAQKETEILEKELGNLLNGAGFLFGGEGVQVVTLGEPEDYGKILEKELNLSASQKARIDDLLQKKQAEMETVFSGQDGLNAAGMKKIHEIEKRYNAAVRNELDATQQAKYDKMRQGTAVTTVVQPQPQPQPQGGGQEK